MKEEAIKFYQNYRLIIFPVAVALCSLVLIIGIIFPQISKLLNNQSSVGGALKKSQFLEAKAKELENYDQADLKNKVNYVLSSLPTEKDFAVAVGILQNLISQTGFNINSLALGSDFKEQNSTSYSINLSLSGPRSALVNLLNNIENSPRLMKVRSLEQTLQSGSENANIVLTVDVLYSSTLSSSGSIDSPLPQLSQTDQEILSELAKLNSTPQVSIQNPSQTQETIPQTPVKGKSNPFQ